ncbi:hypothetical protein LTR70_002323 [Exophiala xenobiotica]|uniref:Calcineurin-like phosphoesterase domain-containing protein n=1 Tax=Lithohypha guttulata TaxID=1690604 RepID=A0ABR0KL22_9EURO|nr:hypothetical protein LTR24_001255 [Lithohypha guttulata]KAK5326058.1 hypothetical protein LTR70_002323 [Exophiala xenobiotica]
MTNTEVHTHDIDLTEYTRPAVASGSINEHGNKSFPEVDVVLHCGDITENGGIENYRRSIEGLASIKAELKLVIAGNHDIDLDRVYYEQECGGKDESAMTDKAMALWRSKIATDGGIVFLEEGTHQFELSTGATFKLYASPYTPAYGLSAFQYPSKEDRFNSSGTPPYAVNVSTEISTNPPLVDIVMTHGPPKYVLDGCGGGSRTSGGCEHLRRAVCLAKPILHCFGHIHSAWGARRAAWDTRTNDGKRKSTDDDIELLPEEFIGRNSSRKRGYASLSPATYEQLRPGEQTLFVNAAVGNIDGEMGNVPWVVVLGLKRKES